MHVLMLVWTDVATDNRVLREAETLVAAGHAVHIIGRHVPPEFEPPAGVTVSSAGGSSALKRAAGDRTSRPLPAPARAARGRLLPTHVASAHRAWVERARRDAVGRSFDVVHAHDFTALPLGAELAQQRGVPLVYDTHEYWYGRPWSGRPTPLVRRREREQEARLGSRAAAVITVGQGVADQLRALHGWRQVTVVRNTFPPGDPAQRTPALPERPVGAVYAGRIDPDRDLETVITAAADLAPLQVTLVGPVDPTYLAQLDVGPATVLPAVDVVEVDRLLRGAGLALVTLTGRGDNHRLAQPNKLFHAVRAGVPVVAADIEQLAQVVRRYGIGTLYRPGDARSLADAVRDAVRRYPELLAAVDAAAEDLSWTRDGAALVGVYTQLAGGVSA